MKTAEMILSFGKSLLLIRARMEGMQCNRAAAVVWGGGRSTWSLGRKGKPPPVTYAAELPFWHARRIIRFISMRLRKSAISSQYPQG